MKRRNRLQKTEDGPISAVSDSTTRPPNKPIGARSVGGRRLRMARGITVDSGAADPVMPRQMFRGRGKIRSLQSSRSESTMSQPQRTASGMRARRIYTLTPRTARGSTGRSRLRRSTKSSLPSHTLSTTTIVSSLTKTWTPARTSASSRRRPTARQ